MPNYTGDIDLEGNEIENIGLESRTDNPTTNLYENRLYYNSVDDTVMVYENGAWVDQLRDGINTYHSEETDQGVGVYRLTTPGFFLLNEIQEIGETRTIVVNTVDGDVNIAPGDVEGVLHRSCPNQSMVMSSLTAPSSYPMFENIQIATYSHFVQITIYSELSNPGLLSVEFQDMSGATFDSSVFEAGDVEGTLTAQLSGPAALTSFNVVISGETLCAANIGLCPNGNIFGEMNGIEGNVIGDYDGLVCHPDNTIRGSILPWKVYQIVELMAVSLTEWVIFGDSKFSNVDNTSDENKPVSSVQQTEIDDFIANLPRFNWIDFDGDLVGTTDLTPHTIYVNRGDGLNMLHLTYHDGTASQICSPRGRDQRSRIPSVASKEDIDPWDYDDHWSDMAYVPATNTLYGPIAYDEAASGGFDRIYEFGPLYMGYKSILVTYKFKPGVVYENMPRGFFSMDLANYRIKADFSPIGRTIYFKTNNDRIIHLTVYPDGRIGISPGVYNRKIATGTTLSVETSINNFEIEVDILMDFANYKQIQGLES